MMRLETERMLSIHLYNLAQHERLIENERIKLNEHFRFQPDAAFKRIDRLNNKKVNTYDLATFLRDNSYNYYSVDLIDLVKSYDAGNNGFLEINQLKKLFVTRTDSILARRANERYEEYVGIRDRLALDVELSMAKILDLEIQGLKKLNHDKEQLKNRYDFSKLDSFKAIDTYRLNSILRDDIKHFLNRNGIQASSLDADYIFGRIDLDQDGRITYTEFCDYLERIPTSLPPSTTIEALNKNDQESNKNQNLRSQSIEPNHQKQNQLDKSEDRIKPQAQQQFYQTPVRNNSKKQIQYDQDPRLAVTEKKKHKFQNQLKNQEENEEQQELEQSPNNKDDEIRRNFIIYGVRSQNSTPLRRSASAQNNSNIQMRQSLNNFNKQNQDDEKQNVNDFSEDKIASLETTPSPAKQQQKISNNDSGSGIKQYQKSSPQQQQQYNNQRQMNLDDIEEEEKENMDSFNEENNKRQQEVNQYEDQVQVNEGDDEDANCEDNEEINGNQGYIQRQSHYLEPNEEENLAEAIKNMIHLETEIEKQKQAISLKADFNLLDAFRLFDKTIAGEIFKQDLEEGFKKLGIYIVEKKELDLFFKRHDKNCDYKLRYLEFTDAFTPRDRIYADHLANKKPNYEARHPDEAISLRTKLEFGDVIRNMLRFEKNIEEIRLNLTKSPQFSISAAFQTLDVENKGFIIQSDIKNFLEDHEFFATQKEVDLLYEKIDKDRDGKISYGEFFTEMAQKLPY